MTPSRTPASTWHDRVAHWRSSGLTARAYADQHGLSLERLRYWSARVGREVKGPQLLPVRVQGSRAAATALELHSPSGWIVRFDAGTDPAWLGSVLQALR